MAGILKKSINPAVPAHLHKPDHVNKQARVLGRQKRHIEEIAILWHLREHRLELLFEHFEFARSPRRAVLR